MFVFEINFVFVNFRTCTEAKLIIFSKLKEYNTKRINMEECSVCLDSFDNDSNEKKIKICINGHHLHYECFRPVCRVNGRRCPICREDISQKCLEIFPPAEVPPENGNIVNYYEAYDDNQIFQEALLQLTIDDYFQNGHERWNSERQEWVSRNESGFLNPIILNRFRNHRVIYYAERPEARQHVINNMRLYGAPYNNRREQDEEDPDDDDDDDDASTD